MRVALISDIHGNAVGLEAALADIRKIGVDKIVCLGDLATVGPRPAECIDAVRDLECPVVMGNVDYYSRSMWSCPRCRALAFRRRSRGPV